MNIPQLLEVLPRSQYVKNRKHVINIALYLHLLCVHATGGHERCDVQPIQRERPKHADVPIRVIDVLIQTRLRLVKEAECLDKCLQRL